MWTSTDNVWTVNRDMYAWTKGWTWTDNVWTVNRDMYAWTKGLTQNEEIYVDINKSVVDRRSVDACSDACWVSRVVKLYLSSQLGEDEAPTDLQTGITILVVSMCISDGDLVVLYTTATTTEEMLATLTKTWRRHSRRQTQRRRLIPHHKPDCKNQEIHPPWRFHMGHRQSLGSSTIAPSHGTPPRISSPSPHLLPHNFYTQSSFAELDRTERSWLEKINFRSYI
ncbi:hypothetical protein YC2023_043005 [Brassica napus]